MSEISQHLTCRCGIRSFSLQKGGWGVSMLYFRPQTLLILLKSVLLEYSYLTCEAYISIHQDSHSRLLVHQGKVGVEGEHDLVCLSRLLS